MGFTPKNQKKDSLCSLIFDHSAEAILVTDAKGKIIEANTSCLNLFEYSLDELVGQEVEKLIPNDLKNKHTAHRANFVKTPESRKMSSGLTLTGIKKSEEKLFLQIGLSYVKSEGELFIVCFISDVSDREKWLNKIRYQKRVLKKYLDITSSIFIILDSKENIVSINNVACKILGISRKEAIGKNWFKEFLPADELKRVRAFYYEMLNGKIKDSNTNENHILDFEGNKRLFEWNNTIIRNKDGTVDSVLCNGVDITERRNSEDARTEALITGQELERRRIAQELHDGLGQAISAIGLNLNALEPELEAFNLRFKNIYLDLKEKLDNAFEEIRAITKNLTPKIVEDFGLAKALEYLEETLDNSTNVELHFSLHGDLENLDRKFSLNIYRIVQELLSNAFRHASAKNIYLYVTRSEKAILVIVEDDGIGFKPDKSNFGFGISNLKARVELLKGQVSIDSNEIGGTSVSINIPL